MVSLSRRTGSLNVRFGLLHPYDYMSLSGQGVFELVACTDERFNNSLPASAVTLEIKSLYPFFNTFFSRARIASGSVRLRVRSALDLLGFTRARMSFSQSLKSIHRFYLKHTHQPETHTFACAHTVGDGGLVFRSVAAQHVLHVAWRAGPPLESAHSNSSGGTVGG